MRRRSHEQEVDRRALGGGAMHLAQPFDVQLTRRRAQQLLGVQQAWILRPTDAVAQVAQGVADDDQCTADVDPSGRSAEHVVGQVEVDDQHEVVGLTCWRRPAAHVLDDPVHAVGPCLGAGPLDAHRREVDRSDLPAVSCQPQRVSPFAGAKVECPPGSHRPDDFGDGHVRFGRPQPVALGVAVIPAGDVVARGTHAAVVLFVLAGHAIDETTLR